MISSLEHASLLVRDIDAAIAAYRQILGRPASLRTEHDGVTCAVFALQSTCLRILSPTGDSESAQRLRSVLERDGDGLLGLRFEVDDIARWHRRLRRLSLAPQDIRTELLPDSLTDPAAGIDWTRQYTALDQSLTGAVQLSMAQAATPGMPSTPETTAPIADIDLVVVATAEPERAAALYGARLGLPMIFDRVMGQGGSRLMQFQCGPQLIEVTHRPIDAPAQAAASATATDVVAATAAADQLTAPARPDKLWGIAWAVTDIDAVHARLQGAGRNVSAVKTGAKPGTRVFTLRDGTCGVPTLVVQTLDPATEARTQRTETAAQTTTETTR